MAASVMVLVRPAPALYHFSASAAWLSWSVLCPAAPIVHVPVHDGFWPSALRSLAVLVYSRFGPRQLWHTTGVFVHACCCAYMLLCMHSVFLCVCRLRHPRIDILGSDSLGSAPSGSNPSGSRRLWSPIGLGHSAPGRVDCSRSLHSPLLPCLVVCMLSPARLCVRACSHGCDDSWIVLV